MRRAATIFQPAQNGFVASCLLHAIDAPIVGFDVIVVAWPGDDYGPGDERGRFARPAGLDGQAVKVDILAGDHHILTGGMALDFAAQAGCGFEERADGAENLGSLWRLWLSQIGEKLAQLDQLVFVAAQGPGHTLDRAEQIDQYRDFAGGAVRFERIFQQQRRAVAFHDAALKLGCFQLHADRLRDAHQRAAVLAKADEVSQVGENWLAACV